MSENINITIEEVSSDINIVVEDTTTDINITMEAATPTVWGEISGTISNQEDLTNLLNNYVIDTDYIHTDNNYTTTEKNKLEGIATGAEVNVNSDWNAVSGDAQILNKPDIANIARQSISETAEGLTYSNTTGVLSLTNGYIIPTLTNFNNKVDKESGKGLSENDFTDALKSKLDGIEVGAEVNTVYSVNGQTNTVVLDTDDISEGANNSYYTDAKVDSRISIQKGMSNGLCPLNSNTRIDMTYLPKQLTSALIYMGTHDASTGIYPTETPNSGNYWLISIAGTIDSVSYNVGDWIIYNEDAGWDRIPLGTGSNVSSVNNKTGDVTLTTSDIAEGTNLYYSEARVNSNTEVQKGVTSYGWGNHASAGYSLDSQVVHKTGNEIVYGNKTFDDTIYSNDRLNVGSSTFDLTNPEFLKVDGDSSSSVNIISGYGTYDDYLQLNIKNRSNGKHSSSDIVATADIGQEGANYVDMGINGSNYNSSEFDIVGALDGYLYVNGGDLAVGTDSPNKNLKFFTGGTLQKNKRAELSDTNFILDVDISASNLSGTNTGDQDLSNYATIEDINKLKSLSVAMSIALG